MGVWRKVVAGSIGVAATGVLLANQIKSAVNVVEAPTNIAKLWGFVRSMFSFTPEALVFLLVAIVSLVVVLWRPVWTDFIRAMLPNATSAATPQTGGLGMSDGPKNVFSIGDNNTVSGVHVGDVVYNGVRYYHPDATAQAYAPALPRNKPIVVLPTISDAGVMAFCRDLRTALAKLGFQMGGGPEAEAPALGFPYFQGIQHQDEGQRFALLVGDVRIP